MNREFKVRIFLTTSILVVLAAFPLLAADQSPANLEYLRILHTEERAREVLDAFYGPGNSGLDRALLDSPYHDPVALSQLPKVSQQAVLKKSNLRSYEPRHFPFDRFEDSKAAESLLGRVLLADFHRISKSLKIPSWPARVLPGQAIQDLDLSARAERALQLLNSDLEVMRSHSTIMSRTQSAYFLQAVGDTLAEIWRLPPRHQREAAHSLFTLYASFENFIGSEKPGSRKAMPNLEKARSEIFEASQGLIAAAEKNGWHEVANRSLQFLSLHHRNVPATVRVEGNGLGNEADYHHFLEISDQGKTLNFSLPLELASEVQKTSGSENRLRLIASRLEKGAWIRMPDIDQDRIRYYFQSLDKTVTERNLAVIGRIQVSFAPWNPNHPVTEFSAENQAKFADHDFRSLFSQTAPTLVPEPKPNAEPRRTWLASFRRLNRLRPWKRSDCSGMKSLQSQDTDPDADLR